MKRRPAARGKSPAPGSQAPTHRETIPGAAVRDLVQRNESEIDALHRQLDAALQEAEEAERSVADLSGTPNSSVLSDDAPGDRAKHSPRPPRTTVVTRSRPATPPT
jgi:hypothetical protein